MGNLNFRTTPVALTEHLSAAGEIVDVYLATDRDTGRPRGFAFVTFAEESQAIQAIQMFNGVDFDGRQLNINEARERERERGPGPGPGSGPGPGPWSPRKPRPFVSKGPPRKENDFPPRGGGFREEFVPPAGDIEFDLDGSSWGESRDSHWGDEEDDEMEEGEEGGSGGGGRRKLKNKGSRRRLRSRKKGL